MPPWNSEAVRHPNPGWEHRRVRYFTASQLFRRGRGRYEDLGLARLPEPEFPDRGSSRTACFRPLAQMRTRGCRVKPIGEILRLVDHQAEFHDAHRVRGYAIISQYESLVWNCGCQTTVSRPRAGASDICRRSLHCCRRSGEVVLFERDADVKILSPRDPDWQAQSVLRDNQHEAFGDTHLARNLYLGPSKGQVADHAMNGPAAGKFNPCSFRDAVTRCDPGFGHAMDRSVEVPDEYTENNQRFVNGK
jgi:hypothetical protein